MAVKSCIVTFSVPDLTDDAPSYDELLESGAGRLKTEINNAIPFCVSELSSKSLGTSSNGRNENGYFFIEGPIGLDYLVSRGRSERKSSWAVFKLHR